MGRGLAHSSSTRDKRLTRSDAQGAWTTIRDERGHNHDLEGHGKRLGSEVDQNLLEAQKQNSNMHVVGQMNSRGPVKGDDCKVQVGGDSGID